MKYTILNLLLIFPILVFGQEDRPLRHLENSNPWSFQVEYSPVNIALTKTFDERAVGLPRPADVSNRITQQFGIAVFRHKNSFACGVALSSYSFRQNLKITIPNDLDDGTAQ